MILLIRSIVVRCLIIYFIMFPTKQAKIGVVLMNFTNFNHVVKRFQFVCCHIMLCTYILTQMTVMNAGRINKVSQRFFQEIFSTIICANNAANMRAVLRILSVIWRGRLTRNLDWLIWISMEMTLSWSWNYCWMLVLIEKRSQNN